MSVNEELHARRSTLATWRASLRAAERERLDASWALALDATDEARARYKETLEAVDDWYADAERYERLTSWKRAPLDETVMDREVRVLASSAEPRQIDGALLRKISSAQADLSHLFATHRAEIDGAPTSNAEIEKILTQSDDVALREKAWRAFRDVGREARAPLIELVELRNEAARSIGYRDHYAMALAQQELDEDELFGLLQRLERATRAPFRTRKAVHDVERAERFGISTEELRPWHYQNVFFQRVYPKTTIDLDEVYAGVDFTDVAARFFDGLGLNVRGVLEKSDLYPREGKNQHAFCTDLDREGDTRILCNIVPGARWMTTLLHELGHAAYNRYIARSLPWSLRGPASIAATEAIAMLMGRQATNVEFLIEYTDLPAMEVTPLSGELRRMQAFQMQAFVRWALVMVHFERALYADPRREDLDAHWFELVERFQLVPPVPDHEGPDWAAKIHFAIAPAYYHNYVLGEVMASQLHAHIAEASRQPALTDSLFAGEHLIRHFFEPGRTYPADELIERCTGAPLSTAAFVREFT